MEGKGANEPLRALSSNHKMSGICPFFGRIFKIVVCVNITRYIPVHFMYQAEFQLTMGKQYSTILTISEAKRDVA